MEEYSSRPANDTGRDRRGGEGIQSDMTRARYLRSTLQSAPRHLNLTVLPSSAITKIRSFVKRWQRLFSKMGLGALSDSTTTGSTNR